MLKKELRGRKIKITRSMDAEERFHNKRMGYVKYCIHTRHGISLASISPNRFSKHVSVDGQIVVGTCQSGSLKYHKYQDIESVFEEQMEKCLAKKKNVATTVSSREVGLKRREEEETMSSRICTESHKGTRKGKVTVVADKSSNTLTATFHDA